MNITEYVQKFGNESFINRPFSHIDAMVLAALAYVKFELISPDGSDIEKPIYFRDLTPIQIDAVCKTRFAAKDNKLLLDACVKSERFKNICIKYIMQVSDKEYLEQFFAATYLVPDVGYIVMYRGTDSTATGWKENFMSSVHEATASQIDAVEYLHLIKKYIGDEKIMIGGHSKGGNLAFYAMFYSPKEITDNITRAYSFEGTGFSSKKFKQQAHYKELLPRLVQIVPEASLVGELFYTPDNHIIIASNGKGFDQHNMYLWKITEDGDFEYLKKRHFFGLVFHRAIKKCAKKVPKDQKKLVIDIVIDSFTGENDAFQIYGAEYGSKTKRVKNILKANYTKSERKIFYRFIVRFILYCIGSCFVCGWRKFKSLFKKKK